MLREQLAYFHVERIACFGTIDADHRDAFGWSFYHHYACGHG
jgi:hypothetical protein